MSTYLWPTILDDPYEISSDAEILESFFDQIFSPYKTIYLSQARHFIPLVLRYYNLGRSDIIFTPPYSSHCLLSNIALQATPTVQNELNNEINASIIYHQYGKKEKLNHEIYDELSLGLTFYQLEYQIFLSFENKPCYLKCSRTLLEMDLKHL